MNAGACVLPPVLDWAVLLLTDPADLDLPSTGLSRCHVACLARRNVLSSERNAVLRALTHGWLVLNPHRVEGVGTRTRGPARMVAHGWRQARGDGPGAGVRQYQRWFTGELERDAAGHSGELKRGG